MRLRSENEKIFSWRKYRLERQEKMTKKDYELIAEALKIANGSITVAPYDSETALSLVSVLLADRLEKENPRFNRARFLSACGVVEN